MNVREIPHEQLDSVVDTLCEAFYHYPVMRFVIGPDPEDFDTQYRKLIRLFNMARVLSGDILLGVGNPPVLHAAASVTRPETTTPCAELVKYRNETWAGFGPDARRRYDAFCDACAGFDVSAPHHHLNMIGVRDAWQGHGLARKIIEYVESLSAAHPASAGVSLSTESSGNVPFYRHLGFELTGHAVVGPGLETWNFFKPN